MWSRLVLFNKRQQWVIDVFCWTLLCNYDECDFETGFCVFVQISFDYIAAELLKRSVTEF